MYAKFTMLCVKYHLGDNAPIFTPLGSSNGLASSRWLYYSCLVRRPSWCGDKGYVKLILSCYNCLIVLRSILSQKFMEAFYFVFW